MRSYLYSHRNPLLILGVFMLFLLMGMNCTTQDRSLDPFPGSPGAVLTGTLRADEAGVADATVRLEPMVNGVALSVAQRIAETMGELSGTSEESGAGIRVTISDANGRYSFDGLEAGEYLIATQAKDHLAGSALAMISRDLAAAAGTTFVDIYLMPTGTFTGNATLQNMTDHFSTIVYVTGSSNVAVTDSAGDYGLSGVPVGTHTIQATHTGWLDQSVSGTLTAAGDSVALESMVLPRDANIAPVVEIAPLPQFPAQTIHEAIPFEASASDPDGTIELVEWDFQDDGVFEVSDPSAYNVNFSAPDTGNYRVKVRVTDNKGAIGLAALNYEVKDAVYVSGEDGDNAYPGTSDLPVQTIQQGITLAEPEGLPVIVNIGSYWEEVEFKSNVPVWGGYDRESGWTKTPGSYSEVWLQSYYEHVATANGVTNATVRGLEIEAEAAQGDGTSAIALKLISCDSTLVFNDCRIIAGSAAAALTAGTNGIAGAAGNPGENGLNGCFYDISICNDSRMGGAGGTGAVTGGAGGQGGWYDSSPHNAYNGYGPAGGSGGATVEGCTNFAGDGGNATPGVYGSGGTNGAAISTSYGTIVGNTWVGESGLFGSNGQDGQEGSGGGGGGAIWEVGTCYVLGASGGGGGGAGAYGTLGIGGNPGGASIAVLCIGSSPTFDSCFIQTGNGGNGWRGGSGGAGGTGGAGGLGGTGYWHDGVQSGDGGDGSAGGNGGGGGAGSGGPGGPSIGIYNFNGSAPTLISITWSIGSGGAGGPGGTHGNGSPTAPAGPAGPSEQIYNHP